MQSSGPGRWGLLDADGINHFSTHMEKKSQIKQVFGMAPGFPVKYLYPRTKEFQ